MKLFCNFINISGFDANREPLALEANKKIPKTASDHKKTSTGPLRPVDIWGHSCQHVSPQE